jgi:hypothetical protein
MNMNIPNKKAHVLQNTLVKNQNHHMNMWNPLLNLRLEREQHGLNPPCRKHKDINLPVAPSDKVRNPKGFPIMQRS